MLVLQVTGMGCGGCVGKITKAIQQLDAAAIVEVDREAGRVMVESLVRADQISKQVRELGFPNQVTASQ